MLLQGNKRQSYDLVLRHSSVATILYHTGMKKLILVKQFRPAVLVGHVLRQPENFNKKLTEIDWAKYDASNGYTLELCAGMIDKKLPVVDIAREEIEEECGYAVKNEDIHLVTTFNVAAHESGGVQYLFYAEINDSMKVTEGGGNASEDEYITKVSSYYTNDLLNLRIFDYMVQFQVFLTEDEVRSLVSSEYPPSPSSMLYALMWWLENKCSKQKKPLVLAFS
ncbi:unnamed protein product [Cylicostephanus goldi]|uniref:Uridine diphosphate glucose pyrophosphatase NUDT14 n=1 Tax=Cylicostephanus goldi TaxID=71465 RepID=A0A3P6SUZ5_CYLGO|nr:unnamed protein product [Cylicostephanus goldi]